MLKAQLHIHSKEDKKDHLDYTAKDVIDKASKLGFNVISFTFHDALFYPKEIVKYAEEKGILLIPGIEKTIEGSHVLIIGLEKLPNINKLSDLKKIKDSALIIAPHPFYPRGYSLKEDCIKNIDLFDGIEHSFFYNDFLNFNKKAIKVAKKHNKSLLGTSDVHNLAYLDSTYSLIDSKKNMEDVIKAIKENKLKIITKPISLKSMLFLPISVMFKKLVNNH